MAKSQSTSTSLPPEPPLQGYEATNGEKFIIMPGSLVIAPPPYKQQGYLMAIRMHDNVVVIFHRNQLLEVKQPHEPYASHEPPTANSPTPTSQVGENVPPL